MERERGRKRERLTVRQRNIEGVRERETLMVNWAC